MFAVSPKLQRWYSKYNKEFFDGALPKEVQVGFNDAIPDDHGVQITVNLDYPPGHEITQIHLNEESHKSNRQLKMSLLHEMCHIQLHPWSKHGKRFDQAMLGLAAKGAFNDIW